LLKAASPLLLVLLAASLCPAQTKPVGFAVFSRVETSTLPTGLDLTIICTRPVAPGFTQLKDPDRLVIDLPDTVVGNHPQSVPLTGPDVRTMRINQFQKDPPIARIVLDLLGERDYSYEPKGVAFVVHLRSAQPAPPNPTQPAAAVEGSIGIGLPQARAKTTLASGNVLVGNAAGSTPGVALAINADGHVEYDDALMSPPERLSGPDPEYTYLARAHDVQGVMVVKCLVTIFGVVRDCRVLEGLPYMEGAVVDALLRRRYTPARLANGRAIDVEYTFRIRLQLVR